VKPDNLSVLPGKPAGADGNDESIVILDSSFRLRHSSFFRPSDFVIRH